MAQALHGTQGLPVALRLTSRRGLLCGLLPPRRAAASVQLIDLVPFTRAAVLGCGTGAT